MPRGFKTLTSVGACSFSILGLLSLFWLDQFHYRLSHAQEINFKAIHVLTWVFFLGGLAFGIIAVSLRRGEPANIATVGGAVSVLLSLVGLLLFRFDIGTWGVHSAPSALNVCLNNQRSIEVAKEQWALRTGSTSGTTVRWDDIAPDFPNGFPRCPEGGQYEIGKAGEPSTCSIPEHRIPVQATTTAADMP